MRSHLHLFFYNFFEISHLQLDADALLIDWGTGTPPITLVEPATNNYSYPPAVSRKFCRSLIAKSLSNFSFHFFQTPSRSRRSLPHTSIPHTCTRSSIRRICITLIYRHRSRTPFKRVFKIACEGNHANTKVVPFSLIFRSRCFMAFERW